MYRAKQIITFSILIILSIIFELNIFNKISILGVAPNMFLIIIVYATIIMENKISTVCIITAIGILFDICFGRVIGIYGLIAFLISTLLPRFYVKSMVETKLGMMIYIIAICFLNQVLLCTVNILLIGISISLQMIINIIITPLYTAMLILIIHPVFSSYIKEENNMFKIQRKY